MKKSIITIVAVSLCCVLLLFLTGCPGDNHGEKSEKGESVQITKNNRPWNVTVFLDLSDRLLHGNPISQTEIDTTIVNHVVDLFIQDCLKDKIIGSKNSFQVLCYPTPSISTINTLMADLKLDMSKLPANEKRKGLINLQNNVSKNLGIIYSNVIANKSWVGCDIWDFFSSKRVDQYCVKEGYRNILLILTDGYLFHTNHKIKEDDAYSYILPQTLAIENSSLITKRDGLTNLEVLFLEINPFQPSQRDRMFSVIGNWLEEMGVPKDSYLLNETDTPANTEIIINSFLN